MQRFFVPAGSVAPAADGQQGARPGVSVRWKWSTMRHVAGTPKPFGPASQADGACGSTEHDDSGIEDFAPDIGRSPHAEEDEELPVETGNGLILRVLQEKPLKTHQQAQQKSLHSLAAGSSRTYACPARGC